MAIRESRKRINRKPIPYGMQNFEDVIKEDLIYRGAEMVECKGAETSMKM